MVIIHKKHKESADEKESRRKKEQESAMGIQDQYQARGFELVSWVQDHKGFVIGLIVFILVVGAALSAFLYYERRSAEVASAAYMEVLKDADTLEPGKKEDGEKLKSIQANLIEVANSYSGTKVAILANLYAGHLALQNNDANESVKLYQNALAKIKQTDPLYPLAMIGLGFAHEKSGDNKKALQNFESVIELKSGLGADLALYEAARLATAEDPEKAKKYVGRLLEEYPSSVYEKNAKKLKAEVSQ